MLFRSTAAAEGAGDPEGAGAPEAAAVGVPLASAVAAESDPAGSMRSRASPGLHPAKASTSPIPPTARQNMPGYAVPRASRKAEMLSSRATFAA